MCNNDTYFTSWDYLIAWWGPVSSCVVSVRSCAVLCGPVRCLVGPVEMYFEMLRCLVFLPYPDGHWELPWGQGCRGAEGTRPCPFPDTGNGRGRVYRAQVMGIIIWYKPMKTFSFWRTEKQDKSYIYLSPNCKIKNVCYLGVYMTLSYYSLYLDRQPKVSLIVAGMFYRLENFWYGLVGKQSP